MDDKPYACRMCGKRFAKRRSMTYGGYCSARCGTEAAIEANAQLRSGVGPVAERWVLGVLRHVERGGMPPPPKQTEDA